MKLTFLALLLALTSPCNAEENIAVTDTIQQVKTQHESQLMAISGVVSVGIGEDYNGQSAIIIGVESPDKLDKMQLPKKLDGYPVKVQIMGTIRAQ
jgi:microsomal dipeptidase-like Zn-dependent dipeptidase